MFKKIILTLAVIASSSLFASEIITLADGRQVQLHDDFTWQYLASENNTKDTANTLTSTATSAVAIAIPAITTQVTTKQVGTTVTVGSSKPTMQLSNSGVDVILLPALYQDSELVIPTAITNQGLQPVVLVEVDVLLSDTSGALLESQTVKIWSSIKRMADTYLRPAQSETGKDIRFTTENSEQFQLSATISKVETR